MEQPLGLSMVNSIVYSTIDCTPYTLVTLATYYSRVPYSFDIGLNSLTTPPRLSKPARLVTSATGYMLVR
jgi:hypothetical protein